MDMSPKPAVVVTLQDFTSPGTFTHTQYFNTLWSIWYQLLFQYNRCPWVEREYAAGVLGVNSIEASAIVPDGAYNIELHDVSDVEGALGYHEDFFASKVGPSGMVHALRSIPDTGVPVSKVFCQTTRDDGLSPTEVISHEALEMLVDPFVMREQDIKKVLNKSDHEWYIIEVGDPVQGMGYDVGAPEGRPTGVPEAIVANWVWPAWYGLAQTRPQHDFAGRIENPYELAPGGYQSVAPENDPTNWSQIYGSEHAPDRT